MPQVQVTEEMRHDLHVIGLTDGGDVIQVDEGSDPYTTGENLVQWGLHNLRKIEVERLLGLNGIREIDRLVLAKWHDGLTEDENYEIALAVGMPF